jgi:histidine triad (HIT) family protein
MVENNCLFCRVVSGDVPATVVFEDENSFAFLDHRPLFPGHCLLVPKEHCETLVDLASSRVGALFENAKLLCRAVEEAMEAEGTFVAINNRVSQSVPHLHVHIVPRRKKDGLKGFFWPRTKYKNEGEMVEVKRLIEASLKQQQSKS